MEVLKIGMFMGVAFGVFCGSAAQVKEMIAQEQFIVQKVPLSNAVKLQAHKEFFSTRGGSHVEECIAESKKKFDEMIASGTLQVYEARKEEKIIAQLMIASNGSHWIRSYGAVFIQGKKTEELFLLLFKFAVMSAENVQVKKICAASGAMQASTKALFRGLGFKRNILDRLCGVKVYEVSRQTVVCALQRNEKEGIESCV